MTVSSFIKENRVLVAGLMLPLLLIGLLAFAKTIPASLIPLPQHKVMYSSQNWSGKGTISIEVDDDGKITPVFQKNAQYPSTSKDQNPTTTIYLFDGATNSVEQSSVTLDKDDKVTPLDKFTDIRLSKQPVAPDGYVFEAYYYSGRGSLLTDIFSYRYYDSGPAIRNKGRVIKIPRTTPYYGPSTFLGWTK